MVTPALPPRSALISREPSADPAMNFQTLKDEAIALVQNFAGQGWTDYNAHDPGVTILESLCYALTDLGYRANFPVADLLAGTGGEIPRTRFGPHPPWRAFVSPPVTVDDFRRLLLDRVSGLGNVWLTPRPLGEGVADGLYDIRVHAALPLPGVHPEVRPHYRRLLERVRRMFLHHRPLCEDIGSLRVLRPRRTIVAAALHLDPGANPEKVMAEALYRLALTLAPEPFRRGLDDGATGKTPADLFDGPLAINGLLPPGALQDKPARVDMKLLAERLSNVGGVLGAYDARLWVDGVGWCDDGAYAVGRDEYCSLDAGLESKVLPLDLSVDGRPCDVDRGDVLRRLLELWERHRRHVPLKAAYERAFPMPSGKERALTEFAPLAAQFPKVYGLGDGIAAPATPEAGQLSGFLALFEMLMVDYCDRLADVKTWLQGSPGSDAPVGSAEFRARIPALQHLPPPQAPDDDDVFARLRMPPAQREHLLDFLLTLYGEDAGELPLPPQIRPGSDAAARHRLAIKQALLGHVVALARRRGRGFDYRSRRATRRLAGVELRARILLGDHDVASPRHRRRLAFVEHMKLRPRTGARLDREAGDYRYGLALSAVLQLPGEGQSELHYRGQVAAMIRAAVPAHIGLHVHFVDRMRWRRFHRMHRLWALSLMVDEPESIDHFSVRLRDMLNRWSDEEAAT
jgi:hypothetical protein